MIQVKYKDYNNIIDEATIFANQQQKVKLYITEKEEFIDNKNVMIKYLTINIITEEFGTEQETIVSFDFENSQDFYRIIYQLLQQMSKIGK